jgi:hypothetical protein
MSRPELFVFIALSVGWLSIAAWTFRIARKVDRLSATGEGPGAGAPGRG